MRIKLIAFALCFYTSTAITAQTALKKANKNFSSFDYDDAAKRYEKITNKNTEAERNLAKSYVMIGNTKRAEEHYSKLVNMPDHTAEDVYAYSQVLMNNQKYNEARVQLKSFSSMSPNDKRAISLKN
jgi:peptidoglycan-associated lipoprotein